MTISMKMRSRLVVTVSLSLACAVSMAACEPGPGGPPTAPSDPTKTGYEPPGGGSDDPPAGGGSIDELCAFDCARVANACPGLSNSTCAAQCAASTTGFPMCADVFRSFLQCIATAPLVCSNGGIDATVCQPQSTAVSNCMGGISTGTAGASGGGTKV